MARDRINRPLQRPAGPAQPLPLVAPVPADNGALQAPPSPGRDAYGRGARSEAPVGPSAPRETPALDGGVGTKAWRSGRARKAQVPALPLGLRQKDQLARLPGAGDAAVEARAIASAFDVENAWSPYLRAYSSRSDVAHVRALAETINPAKADELEVAFFRSMVKARASQPAEVTKMFESLPADWYSDPVYYAYVQYFGTPDGKDRATFDDLIKRLDHLEYMGVKNIFILPHYESPGGDGGYDVSDFSPREELGGKAAYERFMKEAISRGFRVMTDIPANHTSTQHPWFQALLRGDPEKFEYYVNVDGARKLTAQPVDIEGRPRNLIKHADDSISAPWLIFPHASDTNWIDIDVGGEKHQFFHTFYPFQLDLNLSHPKVLEELFDLLGSEANVGNAGKRMDAAPHWFKKPGTDFESLKETHALQAIFKSFIRHVVPGKGITLPEVGFGIDEAVKYFGKPVEIGGVRTNSEGDGVFAFEMQAALREAIFSGDAAPFWRTYDALPELPSEAVWFNMLGHHDEARTDLMSEQARGAVRGQLLERGARDFAGRGVGGRSANFLDKDPQRIANAYFALFMAPGTPVIYYGDEIGAEHQPDFMAEEQVKRFEILNALGVPTTLESAQDTRDLNRGPISGGAFDAARKAKYLPLETIKALNALRSYRPSMKSRSLVRIGADRPDVLAAVRSAPNDAPLLGLSNLSSEARTVRLSRAELEAHLGSLAGIGTLADVLGSQLLGRERRIEVQVEADALVVRLPPHGHVILDRSARL